MKRGQTLSLLLAVVAVMGLASVSAGEARTRDMFREPFDVLQRGLKLSPASHYERIYDKAWLKIKDNYVARDKLVEWDRWRHRFDQRLTSRVALVKALNEMVNSLQDDYTYLLSDEAVTKRANTRCMKNVVHVSRLDNNIGYIKLDTFSSDSTVPEFRKGLNQLHGCDAYVIDLRNNHGGYIDAAHQIFSMLAERGMFMTYIGYENGAPDMEAHILQPDRWQLWRNGERFDSKRASSRVSASPLLVLVNEDTRSAAELLAGSLRDGGQAKVLGTKTYGKGVLQDAYELGEHLFLKVTTAKYFLPSGVNIHGKGIDPDVVIKNEPGTDNQLSTATSMLHRALAESRRTGIRALALLEGAGMRL